MAAMVTETFVGPDSGISVFFFPGLGFAAVIPTDIGWGLLSQTLATVPGQSYRVSYVVRASGPDLIDGQPGGSGGFVAIFDDIGYMGAHPYTSVHPPLVPLPPGSPILGIGGAVYLAGTYDETFFATATGNATLIEFASTYQGAFFITQISVDPVPEAPTFLLVVAGLMCVWMRSRGGAGLETLMILPRMRSSAEEGMRVPRPLPDTVAPRGPKGK
jgi:hypothetical protein